MNCNAQRYRNLHPRRPKAVSGGGKKSNRARKNSGEEKSRRRRRAPGDKGRFPFNQNHRFKFSEFSLVEWNASDRFPEFELMCSATRDMLGETLLLLKMADVLNIFVLLERDDCETISCTILDSNDGVTLLAAVACSVMRKELTRVNGYFEVSIPA